MKKKTSLLRSFLALSASALLLAACGGGGGGSDTLAPAPSERFGASSTYEGTCDLGTQKRFVRAYMDEVYLWYREIPEVDPNAYGNIPDYFNALRVRTPDANGLPRDRFSAVLPSSQALDVLRQSSGAQQALTPTLLSGHTDAVPLVFTFTTSTGRLAGYIQFNDHEIGAQDDLINAFRQVRDAGVVDLVLDLRSNSGGFLYIAQTAASMVTGPANDGKVFEQLRYNDKRTAESAASTLQFSSQVQFAETQYPTGTQLPQLGLPRVFVLASPRTCSASESIINSLRGIDVQVILIGTTEANEAGVPGTCGKPYGFRQKNNCGWAYFPIEFQGTNAKGFGDYTAGFRHTCQVPNNTAAPGSADDPLLNAAKTYIETGACPAGTASNVQSSATPLLGQVVRPGRPAWAGRLLLQQQQR